MCSQTWGVALITRTGCAAALVEPAWEYMRVRALAAPAALISMVAQVWGPADSWSPLPGCMYRPKEHSACWPVLGRLQHGLAQILEIALMQS